MATNYSEELATESFASEVKAIADIKCGKASNPETVTS